MRSPVETRCGEGRDMGFQARVYQKRARGLEKHDPIQELRVALNELQNIAVHNECKNSQQEYQTHLHKTLLDGNTQIAPEDSFDSQEQHMATVENRYGE